MTYQRLLALVFLLLIQTDLFALGKSNCGSNDNYTSNIAYGANLNTTLSALYTNIDNDGFYNASTGLGADRANPVALCRGDVQLSTCRECVQRGRAELGDSCPTQKQAVYEDEFCSLRYSNETVYGTLAIRPAHFYWKKRNATNPERFNEDLRALLDSLRVRAAAGLSTRKVAAGYVNGPDFRPIFGLVQCTPDLSSEECTSCLLLVISDTPQCCAGKVGGRVY